MPTKPNQKVDINSVRLLNSIRNELGGTYKDQIPPAYAVGDIDSMGRTITRDMALMRLREIGTAFRTYQPALNAFLDTLVNRIGLVLITNRLYENPWARFKRGVLEYGETVEEIFVDIVEAQQFDPVAAENTLYKRELPNVLSSFHRMNYQKLYPVTISQQQLNTAFLSFEGVSDLISKCIESLYTSANYDEFLMMKYMVAKVILMGGFYPITIPALTSENANQVVVTLKNISELVTFMSTQYNEAGVTTYTDKNYQWFILNTEFLSTIDVEVLARAFNLEYAQLMGHTISVNTFTFSDSEMNRLLNLLYPEGTQQPESVFTAAEVQTLQSVPGVMIDENWMMIFDNLIQMKEAENGKGLYWNYFLHVWKTFSHSPFNTAIAFTTADSAITSVVVSPATASITKGSQMQFTAQVSISGLANSGVTWSLSGNTTSSISPTGLVTVPSSETATSLTITATSVYDTTKSGTATLTIIDPDTTNL